MIIDQLKQHINGDVLGDDYSLGMYSTDASIYQIQPVAVILSKDDADVKTAVMLAWEFHNLIDCKSHNIKHRFLIVIMRFGGCIPDEFIRTNRWNLTNLIIGSNEILMTDIKSKIFRIYFCRHGNTLQNRLHRNFNVSSSLTHSQSDLGFSII